MTIEKAMEILKTVDGIECRFPGYTTALGIAIQALEKQVPKKMHLGTAWGVCPTCDRIVETIQFFKPSYCPHCGQAVIWEE